MNQDTMRIGTVAAHAGVNVQTLRYYERRGLLKVPQRTPSGFRRYPAETVKLIRFIKRSQDLGFALREIEELIQFRQNLGRSRHQVRALATAKIQDVREKIRGLKAMSKALEGLVDACECQGNRLECPILEALDDGPGHKDRGQE